MRKKLGEILVEQGSVGPLDVDLALEQQSGGDPARIGDLLLAAGKVSPLQLAKALCAQSGLPFVQLDQVSPEIAALVPIALQREYCLVPFKEETRGKVIHVAVADPTTTDVLAELEFQVGRELRVSIAARDEIEAVHAALQGDVLEASIVEEDSPAPPPAAKSPQPLARVALKRVAVSADGVMTDVPQPSAPSPSPKLGRSSPTVVSPPPPQSFAPTLEMPVVEAASEAPPKPASSQPLPQRAARPTKSTPGPPPVLKPIEGPAPTAPSRPKSKAAAAMAKKPEPPTRPSTSPDEWAVRPVGAAIPKGPAAAPSGLDPFATLPTEEIGGPREYSPSPSLAPLSALEADPAVRDTLLGPEMSLGMSIPSPTMVEFYVAPPAPLAPSKLAIEPAPLALSPPRRKPPQKSMGGPVPDASLGAAPVASSMEFATVPRPASSTAVTAEAPALVVIRPPPEPVPSGRQKHVETQLEASLPSAREAVVVTEPEVWAAPPASAAKGNGSRPHAPMRTESLEFIPAAESAPPPEQEKSRADSLEFVPSPLDEGHPPTPPGGEPIITEMIEPPSFDEPPAAALPPADLVSGATTVPVSLKALAHELTATPSIGSEPVLSAAPLDEPPPPPSAPAPPAAPIELASSAEPSVPAIELPAWMRDAGASGQAVDDPLVAAVASPGSTTALVRLLRLLVKKGVISEAELIEELKKE